MGFLSSGLKSLGVTGVVSVIFIMPALLLLFLGYYAGIAWNGDSVKTTCMIYAHDVTQDRCSYQCGCTSSTTGARHCNTCYRTCFDGSIEVWYQVNDNTYKKWFEVYSNDNSETYVKSKLRDKYPIGNEIDCFYDKNNPFDSKLTQVNTDQKNLIKSNILYINIFNKTI